MRSSVMVTAEWPMQWSDTYRFVADDPLKVTMKARDAQRTHVGATLVPLVESAQQRLSIISPYFVPGAEVTAALANMVERRQGRSHPDELACRQ